MYEVLNAMRRSRIENNLKIVAHLDKITKKPMEVQTKLLLELLEENKDTEYGKKFNFDRIRSIEEYQKCVPISEYDDYTTYMLL